MFILCEDDNLQAQAAELGRELQLPVYKKAANQQPFAKPAAVSFLVLSAKRLELRLEDKESGPFFIDFNDKELNYRLQRSTRKSETLARAIGLKKNKHPLVFDLTAGLGRDAFVLAQLGCTLHLFERNRIIAALLRDGLERASQGKLAAVVEKISLHTGEALELLPPAAAKFPPDVVYLDPMFPQRTKSALVKKEMRILRALVGEDLDACLLFKAAQKYARDRVVCKRPRQAPFVSDLAPSMSIKTKKHRFDVYLQGDRNSASRTEK
jgi:16S rRNA (guanine1516-N2)-methyltransferase